MTRFLAGDANPIVLTQRRVARVVRPARLTPAANPAAPTPAVLQPVA